MEGALQAIEAHYTRGGILDSILRTLRDMGRNITSLTPSELAPVDEIHVGGREATIDLANRASLKPESRVLDVGSGLGGSVRYLASERQCRATGIDLTGEYVEIANALSQLLGLQQVTTFRQSSALNTPFDDGAFDVVWTDREGCCASEINAPGLGRLDRKAIER